MFFKSFISKSQNKKGDDVWISSSAKKCVIIDAVSISKNPELTKKTIISYLIENEINIDELTAQEALTNLNKYLIAQKKDLLASVCILDYKKTYIEFSSCGNSQIIKLTTTNMKYILEPKNQPENVLGMNNVEFENGKFNIDNSSTYMITTDGLKLKDNSYKDIQNLHNNNDWYTFAEDLKTEEDWSFCVFPFEKTLSYENTNWPYFPFIGQQEEYEHEKEGLYKIANILFKDPEFNGFKILGGPEIPIKNSFRKLDGILISPFGVVLLELKDWYGEIEVPIEGRGRLMKAVSKDSIYKDTSPIVKINESMDNFTNWSIFKDIELQEKRIGAVIFTHDNAQITCVDSIGNKINNQYKSGNIIISKVEDLPKYLKHYWKKDISKGKKYKISEETISTISNNYIENTTEKEESTTNTIIKNGKYSFNKKDKNEDLSTEYYSIYEGIDTRRKRPVWIKEYELTTISKGSIDNEAIRIKREADALQDLNKSLNVQDFKDEDQIGTKLYIILEYIEGNTLQDSLKENKLSFDEKINIINELALTLKDLENEEIIHRSINPKNIIITKDKKPILINFELCKLDFLPTLPPRGRRLLDSSYEAREVNTNSSNDISNAADIYSFGQVSCEILRGELLFKNQKERVVATTKKNKNWHINLAKECSLPDYSANHLKSILSNDPSSRPTVDELIKYVKTWKEG